MTVIQNARLVAAGQVRPCDVAVEGGVIREIAHAGTLRGSRTVDAGGLYLSHGFVDTHVHGGGGCDFMDGTEEAWHTAARLHLTHGTTCMVPTTLASTKEELLRAFAIYQRCKNAPGLRGAKLLGLHIEGPYLAPGQSGAQDPAYLRAPDPAEYRELLDACPDILRWTVAPELPGALEMGDELARRGVTPCMGHSDADEEQVRAALLHGYRVVTHLYSAMSTIVRRQGFRRAGIVECAYLYRDLTSEIIADGCHLPASLLQLAYRQIGPERLCLVTDAMRAAGQSGGESVLGSLERGQRVILEDGVAKMPSRQAFAGSICTADRLVRNMVKLAGASLPDAVRMMTETPARTLGLSHQTGTVAVGRAADLVLFNEDIQIRMAMVDGEIRYHSEGLPLSERGMNDEDV